MKFRRNVAFILTRSSGEILLCERSGYKGSWQFPQGGAQESESNLDALHREVEEEISLSPDAYRIVAERGPYRYVFRSGFRKEGFDGQDQRYFLAEALGSPEIVVDKKEFSAFRWIQPEEFLIDWVPPIKRTVYRRVFQDFFDVRLP
ncbi:MAG: NUDIX domain-containing protein [Verrucomicrobiae bacterium]